MISWLRIVVAAGLIALASGATGAPRKPLVLHSGQQEQIQPGDALQTSAPTTATASINFPHGTAPSSPVNGDCWTTTAGLYCQINGATVGPFIATSGASTALDTICSTQGAVLYRSASAWVCLATGTAGQVLTTGGAAANPSWMTVSSGAASGAVDAQWFGDGSDGNVTISAGTTTLTRDMYYNNLTLTGGTLVTAGWKVFVAGTLDITAAPAGAIRPLTSAIDGGAGSGGGSAGFEILAGSVGNSGANGNSGKAGTTGAGASQSTVSTSAMVGGFSGSSGNGGASGGGTSAGSGAAGQTSDSSPSDVRRLQSELSAWISPSAYAQLRGGGPAPGGAAGGGDGANNAGNGGGGGSAGGALYIAAKTINRGGGTAVAAIQAIGGKGGTGSNGQGGTSGGGGGGAGAGGGWLYLIYHTLSGTTATNALDATGGDGGAGGNGASTGVGGNGGAPGGGGRIDIYDVGAGTQTIVSRSAAGTANAHSGSTGGAAKAATAQQANL